MCHNNSQKGSVIFFAVIVTTLVLGIAFGLNALLLGGLDILQGAGKSILAFYAAEAGAERLLFEDRACIGDTACLQTAINNWTSTGFSNGASYSVTVTDGGMGACPGTATYCAQSTGVFEGVSRRIEIER